MNVPPAQVALRWVVSRPGVSSTLLGVSRVEQLVDNVDALDLVIPEVHQLSLDAVSASADPRMLYGLFRDPIRRHAVFGGARVRGWAEATKA